MQFSKPLASAQTQAHGPGQQQLKGQEGTRKRKWRHTDGPSFNDQTAQLKYYPDMGI